MREELEKRIRHLEQGLDHFSGIDWIVQVGEIAKIKGVVLDMDVRAEEICASRITGTALEELDQEIQVATVTRIRKVEQRRAFGNACRLLKTWLGPVMPPRREKA